MKIACAWCDKQIAIRCDHCGADLIPMEGSPDLACTNGPTLIRYSPPAIRYMKTSHGICAECQMLTPQKRDELARAKIARCGRLNDTNPEKRGPTVLPHGATHREPQPLKKDGGTQ
jgi:hypothetical protein